MKAAVLMVAAVFATSCGYHLAGRADLLPKTIKTVAVPAFTNGSTTQYKLTDRLPEAISREFIARTRYRVVSDPNRADAVLRGSVTNYASFPIVFDSITGRAASVELHVTMQISLVERATGKVLFNRPSMEARERFQIASLPGQYFEESDTALNRVSKAAAEQVVSDILNSF
jgi:outer membrane lipopolysaccharide assembly protein LptE/RlpB